MIKWCVCTLVLWLICHKFMSTLNNPTTPRQPGRRQSEKKTTTISTTTSTTTTRARKDSAKKKKKTFKCHIVLRRSYRIAESGHHRESVLNLSSFIAFNWFTFATHIYLFTLLPFGMPTAADCAVRRMCVPFATVALALREIRIPQIAINNAVAVPYGCRIKYVMIIITEKNSD